MTIEAAIAEAVMKAVEKAVAKEIAGLRADVAALRAELSRREVKDGAAGKMKLLTMQEARERLLVNPSTLEGFINDGKIKVVSTPNGRRKVLESSLDDFIKSLAA